MIRDQFILDLSRELTIDNFAGGGGASTGEREILRGFVTRYREFWMRQPMELYEAACVALQEHYDKMGEPA